jgi:hypothetical protein
MTKISLKNFNKSAVAPKFFVLNFEFLSFEFVSNFDIHASQFRIYCTLFWERSIILYRWLKRCGANDEIFP